MALLHRRSTGVAQAQQASPAAPPPQAEARRRAATSRRQDGGRRGILPPAGASRCAPVTAQGGLTASRRGRDKQGDHRSTTIFDNIRSHGYVRQSLWYLWQTVRYLWHLCIDTHVCPEPVCKPVRDRLQNSCPRPRPRQLARRKCRAALRSNWVQKGACKACFGRGAGMNITAQKSEEKVRGSTRARTGCGTGSGTGNGALLRVAPYN